MAMPRRQPSAFPDSPAAAGTTHSGSGGTRHFLALDAVRGVAAIAVMVHHIANAQHYPVARYGYLAVDLFFIASGFVIGRAYEDRLRAGMGCGRFMAVRLARLYPVPLLGMATGLVSAGLGASRDGPLGWSAAAQVLLIPDLSGGVIFPINGVLWSLFFELVANAAHAALLRRLTTRVLVALLVAAAPAAVLLGWHFGSFNLGYTDRNFAGGFVRVAWGYGLGLLLYRLVAAGRLRPPRVPHALPLVLAATALVLLLPKLGPSALQIFGSVFVVFPAILLVSLDETPVPRLAAVARWLGGISYPLYALNHPLVEIAAWAWGPRLGWAAWVAIAAAILLAATLVETLYDAPLRRRLRERIAAPR